MTKPTVFISSGREGLDIARELGRQLESIAEVTLWSEGAFHPGKTAAESLTEVADRSDFAVFVIAGDDEIGTRHSRWSPRPNLLFELGFLAGRLGLLRTFIVVVEPGRISLPSDLAGTAYISLRADELLDLELAVAPAATTIRKAIVGTRPQRPTAPEYYSCFISYSWQDKDFAAQLHDDLEDAGVRCWLDAKEMRAGDRIQEQIDRAIQAHEKVLLVLSRASVQSAWVRLELRNALRLEHERGKTVLFPLRLDDSALKVAGIPEFEELKTKYIIDFSAWHDDDRYHRAFLRLVRDLVISASVESERPL